MASFYNWISEIIVFLLIAAIIDLLIPKNSYQKYIKLVVGLVLLLVFLKPIFYILNINVEQEVERIFTAFNQESVVDLNKKNNLYEKEIQRGQDAYIYEHMTEQLVAIAKYPLIDEFQLEITNIDFVFEREIMSYETLTELIVYLSEYKGEGRVVKQVKEISINGNSDQDDDESNVEIINLLMELWELEDEGITIVREGA